MKLKTLKVGIEVINAFSKILMAQKHSNEILFWYKLIDEM
jgi:hypothetical protein